MSMVKGILYSILILFFIMGCKSKPVTPETALTRYVDTDDGAYEWSIVDKIESEKSTIYDLLLTSQSWREITWRHQLYVIVPKDLQHKESSLLFISGGKNTDGQPNWRDIDDDTRKMMTSVAENTHAMASVIFQVPNQPLYGDKTEDELISYTFHQYQETRDFTWPLLFPMVKSAVKAMDAIQELGQKELGLQIAEFMVSGGSKRGWTTWLTSALDSRVKATGPMVIDVLNMPVQMDYQIQAWGDYSPEIEDYVALGITETLQSPEGKELTTMVDPYSYREKYTMPKMLFIGTNDPYWPVDAVKHYLDDIPGQTFIHYVANAGHGLGDGEQAMNTLEAFYVEMMTDTPHPNLDYSVQGLTFKMSTDTPFVETRLFMADSDDRDFRDAEFSFKSICKAGSEIQLDFKKPASGFRACYVDVLFKSPLSGTYSKSTRMYVLNSDGIL